jgi:carboxymethylenebutenolidase
VPSYKIRGRSIAGSEDLTMQMTEDAIDNEADPAKAPGPPRQQFVKTSLTGGFAAAVGPVQAQTVIHTDSTGLIAGAVRIAAGQDAMPAYRAAPADGRPAPIVLVVQEIFGVHEHIKDVCRRLAKLGYLAVAPELYTRQGDPSKFGDIPTLYREIVAKVPDAQVMGDLDACVSWAAAHGGDAQRLGITGFCWGGRITWLYAAHNPELKAAVAWYGRLVGDTSALTPSHPIDVASRLHAPVLGLYGGADSGIPLETIERMKQALAGDPAETRTGTTPSARCGFVVYPDAPHAFHADYRPSYRKEAAEDGWRRCLQWLRANGVC